MRNGIRAIVFCAMYFLILSLLPLLVGGIFAFSTLGVGAVRMVLSIVTLWIRSGLVRSVGRVTLGDGVVWFGSSIWGGFVVASKVSRLGTSGAVGSSGVGSGSGALLRMSFSFVKASI